jgi:hypothetical protein
MSNRNYFVRKGFKITSVKEQEEKAAQRLAECMKNPSAEGCKEYLALQNAKIEAQKKVSEVIE